MRSCPCVCSSVMLLATEMEVRQLKTLQGGRALVAIHQTATFPYSDIFAVTFWGHCWPLITFLTLSFMNYLPLVTLTTGIFFKTATSILGLCMKQHWRARFNTKTTHTDYTGAVLCSPDTSVQKKGYFYCLFCICLPDSPVSWGGYEVEAAVNSAVGHLPSVHPWFRVQVVFKLAVYVVNDWLPAARQNTQLLLSIRTSRKIQ